ncbi:MAG: hypothetical protein ACFFDB_00105 [Promethearchaeota archaeon]
MSARKQNYICIFCGDLATKDAEFQSEGKTILRCDKCKTLMDKFETIRERRLRKREEIRKRKKYNLEEKDFKLIYQALRKGDAAKIDKFELSDADYRNKLIEAVEKKLPFVAQRLSGKMVNLFDSDYGFYLKRDMVKQNLTQSQVLRAYSIAKASESVSVRLALREMYYVIRTNENFSKYFDGVPGKKFNSEFMDRINTLEILADVDRINFTISTGSKGYFHYPFNSVYGDPKRKILFTEELAYEVIQENELPYCQSILLCEKDAATNRLIEMGFPKLTNMVISTVQGMYNRAILRLTKRFEERFPLIFFCDADVYGNKMLSLIKFGSKRSRHLTLRSTGSEKIYIAGFFPSVGEAINLPNDKEEKRPLESKEGKAMLKHLQHFDLVDDADIKVWKANKTYELDALSQHFKNTRNEPVGLGIYLVEYMRLNHIPVKPMPGDNIKDDFSENLRQKLEEDLLPKPDNSFIIDPIKAFKEAIKQIFNDFSIPIRDNELTERNEDINNYLDNLDIDTIKKYLIKQYCEYMMRRVYNMDEVLKISVEKVETVVTYTEEDLLEEIRNDVKESLDELLAKIKPKIEELLNSAKVESNLELNELDPEIEVCDLYDRILKELKVKEGDPELIREALAKRLRIKLIDGKPEPPAPSKDILKDEDRYKILLQLEKEPDKHYFTFLMGDYNLSWKILKECEMDIDRIKAKIDKILEKYTNNEL